MSIKLLVLGLTAFSIFATIMAVKYRLQVNRLTKAQLDDRLSFDRVAVASDEKLARIEEVSSMFVLEMWAAITEQFKGMAVLQDNSFWGEIVYNGRRLACYQADFTSHKDNPINVHVSFGPQEVRDPEIRKEPIMNLARDKKLVIEGLLKQITTRGL
jgi:hypothetical protein